MGANPVPVWRTTDAGFEEKFAGLVAGGTGDVPPGVAATVKSIARALSDPSRAEGALVRLARRHDWAGCRTAEDLEVAPGEIAESERAVPAKVREMLEFCRDRIREFHEREASTLEAWSYEDSLGNALGMRMTPVSRAAIYAPGGTALYPSSVLMNAIPARIAGVKEVVMLAPPAKDGAVSPLMLHAASLAGVDRVFRIGGAQAIFAAALGVPPVPKADFIAGPGNAYVAEAKRQAYGHAGIDSIAGPSEVLVIADGSCRAEWIVADLVAQAEHDPLARAILLTTDAGLLERILGELSSALAKAPRKEVVRASLSERGCAILATSMLECVLLSDRIAPEHLQIMSEDAETLAGQIGNAGAIFIGPRSPTVLGDYCAGTNHVLPTGGSARFASPLGVHSFMKRTSFFSASEKGSKRLAEVARRLAQEEGLPAHARAAALRQE